MTARGEGDVNEVVLSHAVLHAPDGRQVVLKGDTRGGGGGAGAGGKRGGAKPWTHTVDV